MQSANGFGARHYGCLRLRKKGAKALKRLTLLALSVSVMTTGCATNLFGLKQAGQPAQSVATVSNNWKFGDPVPKGYGLVTLKVAVPGAERRTQTIVEAGNGTRDAEMQVLLYVRRPSDNSLVYDGFGTKAVYVATIDPTTGLATFRLPPLPGTSLDPAAAPTGTNSNLFEIRVYKRADNTDALTATDQFGHLNPADIDTYAALTPKKLIASGETLSTVVPGMPIIVNVPKIFVHLPDSADADVLNDNLDAFNSVKEISVAGTSVAKQGDEVLVRVTNLDTSKLASGHVLTLDFTDSAAANVGQTTALTFLSTDGVINGTVDVVTLAGDSATAAATKAKAAIEASAEAADFAANYTLTLSGSKLTITSKSMAPGKAIAVTDASSRLATGNISGGVTANKAGFTVTLSGTYAPYQAFNFSFTNGTPTTYNLYGILANTSSLSDIATTVAAAANADTTINADYTASASGNTVTFAAIANGTAFDLDVDPDNNGVATVSAALEFEAAATPATPTQNEDLADPTDPLSVPVPWKYVFDFKNQAINKGDTLVIYTKRPDLSDGPTYSFGSTTTTLDTFLTAARTNFNTSALGFPFTVAEDLDDGDETLTFTGNEVPGASIASVSIAAPASLMTSAEATTSAGAVDVAATKTFTLDPAGADTVAGTDNVNVNFTWVDNTGATRNVDLTQDRTGLVAYLNLPAQAAFSDGFVAGLAGDVLTITAATAVGAKINPYSPAINIPVTVSRTNRDFTLASGPIVNSVDSYFHRLRALMIFPAGTNFSGNQPKLSVFDGDRTLYNSTHNLVGEVVKTGAGLDASLADLTLVNNTSGLTWLLDLDASTQGATAPTSGPWNFIIKLNGADQVPDFFLMDLDTANGHSGNVTAQ